MSNPAAHPTVASAHAEDDGVSAVIGTILVLAITVIGIAGVLFYGAPTIDRIQSRNAMTAMEGAFETLRDSTQQLSVPDHARYPSINLPSGDLGLAQGDRFVITADHDPANISCDLHVTDWSDVGSSVTIDATGCRTPTTNCSLPMAAAASCLEIHSVSGATITKQSIGFAGGVATVATADFSAGDWLFRLTDGNVNPVVYAEAWLHSTDMVTWDLKSSTGRWQQFFDGGAVISQSGGTYFLEKEAPIGDSQFGSAYFGFWLRTLVVPNGNYVSTSGTASHSVLFSLLGVSTRVDDASTYMLRIDINGPLAQPWCNSLLLRNGQLGGGGAYSENAGFTCKDGDAMGLRSVSYACLTCPGAGNPFKFIFLHARIATSLAS